MNRIKPLFLLRKSKKNRQGLFPLVLRVTVNGKQKELSTPFSISLDCWDSKKQKVLGKDDIATKANDHIRIIRTKLYQLQNECLIKETRITAESVKNFLTGNDPDKKGLIEVYKYHNAQKKELVGKDISAGTHKRYETTKKGLQEFIRSHIKQDDILLSELSNRFINDFEFYLKTKKKLDTNTAQKYLKHLRTVVRFAFSNEWLDRDPFEGFKCKTVAKDRGFLTSEELQTLETKEFSTERLILTRDIFVFSCYTGLRYSDVEKLTKDNIYTGSDGQVWLTIATTKTGERCNFPVLPKALTIIGKYENSPECTIKRKLLPVRTNQKMNEYLKEIADLCKIRKRITFHLARHTFATTVTLANGVSLETIMKLLGHRSSRTTQIYAKMVDKRVAQEITDLKTVLTKNITHESINS